MRREMAGTEVSKIYVPAIFLWKKFELLKVLAYGESYMGKTFDIFSRYSLD